MRSSRILSIFLVVFTANLFAQSNAVPFIYQPLKPAAVRPGHAAFTLTVHGTGFVQGAVVSWNGGALPTTFVSESVIQALVPADAVAVHTTGSVTVANPGTIASNVVYLPVRDSSSSLTFEASHAQIEAGEIAVGDFNNDYRPDIAVQAQDPQSKYEYANVYLNQGYAHFKKIAGPLWGESASSIGERAADFNGDGNLDVLLCASEGEISPGACSVYLGNGAGALTPLSGSNINGCDSVGDVNGDGILDCVAIVEDSSGSGSALLVYLGKGDGTFDLAFSQDFGPGKGVIGWGAVLGDFNGDGHLDVAAQWVGHVAVFLGNGDGTFGSESDFPVTNYGSSMAVADLKGEGILDLITSGVSVLLGNGDGNFRAGSSVTVVNPTSIALGDMNGDGKLDLVVVGGGDANTQTVNTLLGNGNGTFQNPLTFSAGQFWSYANGEVADMNGDGKLDVVLEGTPAVEVLLQIPAQ
jgi:hypothetical protein